ncbi:molybdopterin molybdotransferase MoeA [Halobacteriovorax sp. HLS]|uniref:molybdopterin molybdotransferase MoeA n=1 Tax=Halobacteriovorax sp. HLS TaxID=2234000 RepID=UPI000FDA186D|nr:molybdopterin molybdotransferase MoeA [Halobacteriovorax sp. HLS]
MISVKAADQMVREHAFKLSTELVSVNELHGRILAQDLYATREQPPFDRVAMDGIAISFSSNSKRSYKLNGIQKAGMKALRLESEDDAIEVMTGAVLPENCNCVIPYENCDLQNGKVTIKDGMNFSLNDNIHGRGSDYQKGSLLLTSGVILNSPKIAIIASQGLSEVAVKKFPKVAIVSTGDELIEPGLTCEPWQIWKSNPYGIESSLNEQGIPSSQISKFHLLDDEVEVFSKLKSIIDNHEIIILSGGVSMGKFDFVHTVMNDLAAEVVFHKIKQKPGKPLLFAKGSAGQCIFGLPGNPVSALVCMRRYVVPSLESSFGISSKKLYAKLAVDITFKKDFALFSAVDIEISNSGQLIATPVRSNGSGDFASLATSDGFLELPEDAQTYLNGEVFAFHPWTRY